MAVSMNMADLCDFYMFHLVDAITRLLCHIFPFIILMTRLILHVPSHATDSNRRQEAPVDNVF
jgi:hypothetical protein